MAPPAPADAPDPEAVRRSLLQLLALHRVDAELASVELELAALPGRREAAEGTRAAAGAAEEAARAELAHRRQVQSVQEARLEGMKQRVLEILAEQPRLKSNELYRELDAERERLEDEAENGPIVIEILEAMEAVDEAEAALERATAHHRDVAARVEAELRALEARGAELEKERIRLAEASAAASAELGAEERTRYARAVARRPPGVVVIARELCSACQVQIPPQDYVDLVSAARVVACGSCRRLLVHESLIAERR